MFFMCTIKFRTYSGTRPFLVSFSVCQKQNARKLRLSVCNLQNNDLISLPLDQLQSKALSIRQKKYNCVTFSPKVFIPLTKLCRDDCGYCTFAQPPKSGQSAYMTEEQVLAIAQVGAQQGCSEALFTLGDKPELKYEVAKNELNQVYGFESTAELVYHMAGMVLTQTGLIPHINAGVLSRNEMEKLKEVSGSQGMMLESVSEDLLLPGQAHYNCPDKEPSLRLQVLEDAGKAGVPFTTGILIGIGETRADRIKALVSIKESHLRYGHIQEVIIQNFKAKPGIRMKNFAEPNLEELCWTISVARIILPSNISIQCPPNLSDEPSWSALLNSGINDWGGVSPLTRDHVNPERPWPHLELLAEQTAKHGLNLIPRLCVYPNQIEQKWINSNVMKHIYKVMDSEGYLRCNSWSPGIATDSEIETLTNGQQTCIQSLPSLRYSKRKADWRIEIQDDGCIRSSDKSEASSEVLDLLNKVEVQGHELSANEIERLFQCRGKDFAAVCESADRLRERIKGDVVSYVVNRNINYTNVCTYGCRFCGFSKNRPQKDQQEIPYVVPLQEITRRTTEAWDRGATEVCMQGGIHPKFDGNTYLRIIEAAKKGAPDVHVHAFSPLEIHQGATTLHLPVQRYLADLRSAGLGSLPGTAAEVLDDEVRKILCPDKLISQEWMDVIECAHSVGLKTTSTIMFGHCDKPHNWATHLIKLREIQKRTGGITEFVPLPFVHMEAPIYKQGAARKGPTMRECILMHAVGRLALHPHISNVQASWVKMGPQNAASLLKAGCNDMGGTLTNESITRASGAQHGQEIGPHQMDRLIIDVGRTPLQRTTLYEKAIEIQVLKSYRASEVAALNRDPAFSGEQLLLDF